jgi:chorismate mutase
MIDAKQAVQIAREKAADILSQTSTSLEEIERETYKDREVWSITLSLPRDLDQLSPVARLAAEPLQYKRFLIDVETGELVAMKLREVASR